MSRRLRELGRTFKRELRFYRFVARHRRTPTRARILIGAALAYAASPIDLIPDWIPILGHLDDLIVIPGLLYLGLRSIPDNVIRECRSQAERESPALPRPLDSGAGPE